MHYTAPIRRTVLTRNPLYRPTPCLPQYICSKVLRSYLYRYIYYLYCHMLHCTALYIYCCAEWARLLTRKAKTHDNGVNYGPGDGDIHDSMVGWG
jgi:hypothetical protein